MDKECKTQNSTNCRTVKAQQCRDVPEEQCLPREETVCEDTPTEKCDIQEQQKCKTVTENVCRTVEDQKCEKQMVDRFCTQDEEGKLRASIFNGDVSAASETLSDSEDVFSLGAGLTYLEEQTFLVVQSDDRSRDSDVVAFQVRI